MCHAHQPDCPSCFCERFASLAAHRPDVAQRVWHTSHIAGDCAAWRRRIEQGAHFYGDWSVFVGKDEGSLASGEWFGTAESGSENAHVPEQRVVLIGADGVVRLSVRVPGGLGEDQIVSEAIDALLGEGGDTQATERSVLRLPGRRLAIMAEMDGIERDASSPPVMQIDMQNEADALLLAVATGLATLGWATGGLDGGASVATVSAALASADPAAAQAFEAYLVRTRGDAEGEVSKAELDAFISSLDSKDHNTHNLGQMAWIAACFLGGAVVVGVAAGRACRGDMGRYESHANAAARGAAGSGMKPRVGEDICVRSPQCFNRPRRS